MTNDDGETDTKSMSVDVEPQIQFSIAESTNTSTYGDTVTLTANGTHGGTVTFYEVDSNDQILGTPGTVTAADGTTPTFQYSQFSAGTHDIAAVYTSDDPSGEPTRFLRP